MTKEPDLKWYVESRHPGFEWVRSPGKVSGDALYGADLLDEDLIRDGILQAVKTLNTKPKFDQSIGAVLCPPGQSPDLDCPSVFHLTGLIRQVVVPNPDIFGTYVKHGSKSYAFFFPERLMPIEVYKSVVTTETASGFAEKMSMVYNQNRDDLSKARARYEKLLGEVKDKFVRSLPN